MTRKEFIKHKRICRKINRTFDIPKRLTKEEIKDGYGTFTVKDMKDFLIRFNIPDDAPVVIQRIEDAYYEECGWKVYEKEIGFPPSHGSTSYSPAEGCVFREEDGDILFIDLHY